MTQQRHQQRQQRRRRLSSSLSLSLSLLFFVIFFATSSININNSNINNNNNNNNGNSKILSSTFLVEAQTQQCNATTSISLNLDKNNMCTCKDNWIGPDCNICQQDDACGVSPSIGEEMKCDQTGKAENFHRSWCPTQQDSDINALMGGTAYLDTKFDPHKHSASLSIWKEKRTGVFFEWVKCGGMKCTQREDREDNLVQIACEELHCEMECLKNEIKDFVCTDTLASYIDAVGKDSLDPGFQLVCEAGTNRCSLHEALLSGLFGNLQADDCAVGECQSHEVIVEEANLNASLITWQEKSIYTVSTFLLIIFALFGLQALIQFCYRNDFSSYAKAIQTIVINDKFGTTFHHNAQDMNGAFLAFEDIEYSVKGRKIIKGVTGMAAPGELLAIMGPSGAGKSTLLDILASRYICGHLSGTISVDGKGINRSFKKMIGYVAQEDALFGNLTVYESVMFSAMMRLPATMSVKEKATRVVEVLDDLCITHIADSKIGNFMHRGISGGEKRRVSTAMELVTSPKVLFMDEPTSGLDSHTASLLIDIVHEMAKKKNTAVVTTIHQPRINIFEKLDQLLVLNYGRVIYHGEADTIPDYFRSIRYPIPEGYNPADFLIDVLFKKDELYVKSMSLSHFSIDEESIMKSHNHVNNDSTDSHDVEMVNGGLINQDHNNKKSRRHRLTGSFDIHGVERGDLEGKFEKSKYYLMSIERIQKKHDQLKGPPNEYDSETVEVIPTAGIGMQILLLTTRSLKEMCRNPMLFLCHFAANIYVAMLMGMIYYDMDNSGITAVKNRMGFFMVCSMWVTLTSVSAVPLFWIEKPLYLHERSNRFYSSFPYFLVKMLFHLIPLRVIPCITLCIVTQQMCGLRDDDGNFLNYVIIMVSLNITAATCHTLVGMVSKSIFTGILLSIVITYHLFMLSSIFIDFNSIGFKNLEWIQYISFFNFGYEALVQNELMGLKLKDFAVSTGDGALNFLEFNTAGFYDLMFFILYYFCGFFFLCYVSLVYLVEGKVKCPTAPRPLQTEPVKVQS